MLRRLACDNVRALRLTHDHGSALLGLRRPAAVAVDLRQTPSPGVLISPLLRPSRLHCRAAEGEAAGGEEAAAKPAEEAAETTAEEEAAAGEEAAEEEAEVDPFAGLELDSKEFLQRKVEVLEKELADANARVGELEGDMATVKVLVDRNILKIGTTQELVDTYFRLSADFDNFRKRAEVNLVQAKETATADIVKQLLTILDNFERAQDAITTETEREESINNSYQAVGKEMLKALTKLGVEPIESLGESFDPNFHNAIQQAESTEYAEGVVCQNLQRGYKIGDRVVRPAMCVVSAGPGPEGDAEAAPAASEESSDSSAAGGA